MRYSKETFEEDKKRFLVDVKHAQETLVELRNGCLGHEFDADGAVILSHAIRWLSFKLEGRPYEPPTD